MKFIERLPLLGKYLGKTEVSTLQRTFECEWVVGHGNFMLPDPCAVPHSELRKFLRGKLTRVTIEIIGERFVEAAPSVVAQEVSPQLELPLTYGGADAEGTGARNA